jgi:hypothetical protein
MVAFNRRMPAGIPGDINRAWAANVETQIITPAGQPNAPTAYGQAVQIDATTHQVRTLIPTDTAIEGFLVRAFPIQGNGTDPLSVATPVASGPVDVMNSGYITTVLGGTAPSVKQGKVYARCANASAGKPISGVEAAPDATVTATGGNTGNGTFGTVVPGSSFKAGAYKVAMLTATTFSVTNPDGAVLPAGATGAPYSNAQLGFTLTAGGTAFVAGDSFSIQMNHIPLPSSYFTGPADASNNTEVAFNI